MIVLCLCCGVCGGEEWDVPTQVDFEHGNNRVRAKSGTILQDSFLLHDLDIEAYQDPSLFLTHFVGILLLTNPHIGSGRSGKSCKYSLLREARNCESAHHHVFSANLHISSSVLSPSFSHSFSCSSFFCKR